MTYNFVALKTQNYVPVLAHIPTKQSINTFLYHIMSESGETHISESFAELFPNSNIQMFSANHLQVRNKQIIT